MNREQVLCRDKVAEVEIVGSGPDVVIVGTAVPMMWAREAAVLLAERGYRVVNFDYGSGADEPEPRTALDQVPDVLDVMDVLGVESASLVGLSRGAMTAFGVAAGYPERVEELVLAFPVSGREDTMMLVDPDPEPNAGESEESFMRRMLGTFFSEQYLETNLDDAVRLVTTPPGSVARVERSEEEVFSDEMSVSHRTLVIEGGADMIVKPEHPARYVEEIEDTEHVLIPGASHGWLMEQPEAFAQIVGDFLS